MDLTFVLIFFSLIPIVVSKTPCKTSCPKIDPARLNVHVVVQAPIEVAWKTQPNEYYQNKVKHVMSSVVEALRTNPHRKFIFAETVYLYKWFKDRSTVDQQNNFRRFVNDGRIEIVSGAWSTIDETVTHYQSIIDQFTLGLKTVNQLLGKCGKPKIAWQLGPYSHSKEIANIVNSMEYRALMINKMDYKEYQDRQNGKKVDFFWKTRGYDNKKYLFTSIIPIFNLPEVFEQIFEKPSTETNDWLNFLISQASYHRTNNLIVTIGDEFDFRNASKTFALSDNAIRYAKGMAVSSNQEVNIFYSTPICYTQAVLETMQEKNISLRVKNNDAFPMATKPGTNLVGFYTSRPTLKRMEREGNNLLQVAKQLQVLDNSTTNFKYLKMAMGIMQGYQVITGTQRQVVAFNTMQTMHRSMIDAVNRTTPSIRKLLEVQVGNLKDLQIGSCFLRNVSVCRHSMRNHFLVILYNPLTYPVDYYVRLPVRYNNYLVRHGKETLPVQLSATLYMYKRLRNVLPYLMTFLAEGIPPLGLKVFRAMRVRRLKRDANGTDHIQAPAFAARGGSSSGVDNGELYNLTTITTSTTEEVPQQNETASTPEPEPEQNRLPKIEGPFRLGLENGYWFNVTKHGYLEYLGKGNLNISLHHELMFYDNRYTLPGTNGAYAFNRQEPPSRLVDSKYGIFTYQITRGVLYDELLQDYAPWAKQYIRVYKNPKINYVEFEWVIGKMPRIPGRSLEILSRYIAPNMHSKTKFYTDSNGRDDIPRMRNAPLNCEDDGNPGCNMYPILSHIKLKDFKSNVSLSVMVDRAEGGSSPTARKIDLLLHRKLVTDDGLGLDEILSEENALHGAMARGIHYVTLDSETSRLSIEKMLQPWIFIGWFDNTDGKKPRNDFKWEVKGLAGSLPPSIHLLTLEQYDEKYVLIRLENVNITGNPVLVNLNNAFVKFSLSSIVEMTLGGDKPLVKNRRKFSSENNDLDYMATSGEKATYATDDEDASDEDVQGLKILLGPLQIRTFLVGIRYR